VPTIAAFAEYVKQVQAGQYPDTEHSYHIKTGELGRLVQLLKDIG